MAEADEALILRVSHGDAGAVDELLVRLVPDLRAFVARRAGPAVMAHESSSDVVQSVCRELLGDLHEGRFEYRGEAEFRAWMRTAALNKIRHRARHWQSAKRAHGEEPQGREPDEFPGANPTPSGDAALSETKERVFAALEAMPARYRDIVRMARIDGLGTREIAARLDVTEANARMLLSRALARLASEMSR